MEIWGWDRETYPRAARMIQCGNKPPLTLQVQCSLNSLSGATILPLEAVSTSQIDTLMTRYEMIPAIKPYAIEYVNGMTASVRKAGRASPQYFQLMSLAAEAIMAPTMINVQPV